MKGPIETWREAVKTDMVGFRETRKLSSIMDEWRSEIQKPDPK